MSAELYEDIMVIVVFAGFASAAGYFLSWLPWMLRARFRRHTTLTVFEIVDFAMLPAAVFLLMGLSLYRIVLNGVDMPPNPWSAWQRMVTTALVSAIAITRLCRWLYTYLTTPREERDVGVALLHQRPDKRS